MKMSSVFVQFTKGAQKNPQHEQADNWTFLNQRKTRDFYIKIGTYPAKSGYMATLIAVNDGFIISWVQFILCEIVRICLFSAQNQYAVVVITEDVQNVHLLLEYRPHIDVSLTCEHDPKLHVLRMSSEHATIRFRRDSKSGTGDE
ncbi:hypothetical protein ANN_21571 [Periplaneta americana]|uniref:Uncharacterized protein n=1 Tax=Periplaneta americana TaxID=6978 RepID=A0ABQ8S680_PERAM|nr:hypothetical protein ANN_21571 [Periplaneta americana]